jgi:ATP phosphoribosyltransferase regulatory subunit
MARTMPELSKNHNCKNHCALVFPRYSSGLTNNINLVIIMDSPANTLLPSGLYDLLPPMAAQRQALLSKVLSVFTSYGYEQVTPPLLEFEDTLLTGGELDVYSFRVMDPLSGKIMAVRADMTMQVSRIATSLLKNAPRPLRLSYGGQVLRTKSEALSNDRQLYQAGIELIGMDTPTADAEVMRVAIEAVQALGMKDITIDISIPSLLNHLFDEAGVEKENRLRYRDTVTRKDPAILAESDDNLASLLVSLLGISGEASRAIEALKAMALSPVAQTWCNALIDTTEILQRNNVAATITIDPLETRGFEYHTGICFSLFAAGAKRELGRGGRYNTDSDISTGFSLYLERLIEVLPAQTLPKRIFVPLGTAASAISQLHTDGYVTILGLDMVTNPESEAQRLLCSHLYLDNIIQEINA